MAVNSAFDSCRCQGQENVKRAMVAAAGGHNIIMIYAPGSGKTMLQALTVDTTAAFTRRAPKLRRYIRSPDSTIGCRTVTQRPFPPASYDSDAVACWWWHWNQGGEISLSHHGILFMDELPEFAECARSIAAANEG